MSSGQSTDAIYQELKQFSFFADFPHEIVLAFAKLAEPLMIKKGEYLLRRGKKNHSLYFLRSGSVEVLIDNELVSRLTNRGEVIGEMSLIKRQAASADVRVAEDANLYRVTDPEFTKASPQDQMKARQLLDRVYANVLVERLANTSEKAKKFETANRELQAAHQDLRKLNLGLEMEISRRTQEIVQKVKALSTTHLQPARHQVSTWLGEEATSPTTKDFTGLLSSLNEVVETLQPVIELSETANNAGEVKVTTKNVLLLAKDKKLQMLTKLALGGTGVRLTSASQTSELPESDPDLLLVDADALDIFSDYKRSFEKTPTVFMLDNKMPLFLENLKSLPELPVFITHDLTRRAFSIRGISTTVAKTVMGSIFGMEKYLSWGTHVEERPVIRSDQRNDLIIEMKAYFKNLGVRGSILDRAHTVAEELLMNAIYDAPQNPDGTAIYNHLSRNEVVTLTQEQQSQFRYGTDGSVLAISVGDPFGGLTKDILRKYLESCYSGQAGIYNEKKGGAGRGLHMMIEMTDLTVFNVKKGIRTEIISLFYLDQSEPETWQPTFHLFFL